MSSEFAQVPKMLPSTRLAIQAGASALVAVAFVNLVTLDRPYWVILTAVVVMVGTAGETLAKSLDRTLGTLFGLIAGLAIYWLAVLIGVPAILLLIVTAPSVVFFKFANYRLMITAITGSVVLLLELSGASETLILARLLDTAIGAAIAVAASFLILRLPTQRPMRKTIVAFEKTLAAMVHDSLRAVVEGKWNAEIDSKADQLRGSDSEFERLAGALRIESALIGGGEIARTALAVLPVLRGHVDTIMQAAQTAAASGLGPLISDELDDIGNQIAANLDAVRESIMSGKAGDIPRLDPYVGHIEAKLTSKLAEDGNARRNVAEILNLVLALRRLNRSIHAAMAQLDG